MVIQILLQIYIEAGKTYGVKLYHDSSKKLETTGTGATITGTTHTNQLNVSGIATVSGLLHAYNPTTSTTGVTTHLKVQDGDLYWAVEFEVNAGNNTRIPYITSNKGLYFSSDGDFNFGNYAGTENYLQWNSGCWSA